MDEDFKLGHYHILKVIKPLFLDRLRADFDAHRKLDAAVDRAYRMKPFRSEAERLEHLFAMYERLLAAEQHVAADTGS